MTHNTADAQTLETFIERLHGAYPDHVLVGIVQQLDASFKVEVDGPGDITQYPQTFTSLKEAARFKRQIEREHKRDGLKVRGYRWFPPVTGPEVMDAES